MSARYIIHGLTVVLALLLTQPGRVRANGDALARSFDQPPDSARPWTMWHWLEGNISKKGITADFEAMKTVGIGGVLLFDIGGRPACSAPCASCRWWRSILQRPNPGKHRDLMIRDASIRSFPRAVVAGMNNRNFEMSLS